MNRIIVATRFPFITVSILPVFGAASWVWYAHRVFDAVSVLLMALGVAAAHIGANTLNDYVDWNGSDADNPNAGPFNGGSRHTLAGIFDRSRFLILSVIFFTLAFFVLCWFAIDGRPLVLLVAGAGGFLGVLYSLPPFSLQCRGLGEAAIFLAFGPLISTGSCYVLLGDLQAVYALPGIASGLITTCVILVNEIPDIASDAAAGKKTLAVRLGPGRTPVLIAVVSGLIVIVPVITALFRVFPVRMALLSVGSVVPVIMIARGIMKSINTAKALLPFQAGMIVFHFVWSIAFIVLHCI